MKINHYHYPYIALFLIISSNCFIKTQSVKVEQITDVYINTIQKVIREAKASTSSKCQSIIENAYEYVKEINEYTEHLNQLLQGSSMSLNDLTPYYNCNTTNDKHSFYLISTPYLIPQSDSKPCFRNAEYYYYGICLIDGCTINDIKDFFTRLTFKNNENYSITVLNITEECNKKLGHTEYIGIILLGICSILIIFVISNHSLTHLLKCCSKCQKKRKMTQGVINQHIRKFEKSFKLNENCEELLSSFIHTISFNDEGLSYIRGIRAFGMILSIYGITYSNLRSYQLNTIDEEQYIKEMQSFFNSIIIFCIRYSPRLLFSCSGYYLSYKFICYLDKQLEEVLNGKHSSDDDEYEYAEQNNQMELSVINSDEPADFVNSSNHIIELKRDQRKIPISALFKFYLKKLYAFLIVFFFFFIIRYGLFPFLNLILDVGPYLTLYYGYIKKINIIDLLGHLLQYSNFNIIEFNDIYIEDKQYGGCALQLFWGIINEMFFFISTVVIIFFTYKCKQSILLVIFLLYLLFIGLRLTAFFIYRKNLEFTTLFHLNNDKYSLLFLSPLYNYPFYLIGVFFGLLNYAFQKDLICNESTIYIDDDEDEEEEENNDDLEDAKITRPSLVFAFSTLEFIQERPSYTIYFLVIIFFIIIILSTLFQPIYLALQSIDKSMLYNQIVSNFEVNFFYLFDIDLVVILIHLLLYALYVKGQGRFIMRILSKRIWLIFNRTYFSYSIYVIFLSKLIFYQTETMISCDMFNTILYGSVLACVLLIILWIHCIFFEFPLRRTTQFFIEKSFKSKNDKKKM